MPNTIFKRTSSGAGAGLSGKDIYAVEIEKDFEGRFQLIILKGLI